MKTVIWKLHVFITLKLLLLHYNFLQNCTAVHCNRKDTKKYGVSLEENLFILFHDNRKEVWTNSCASWQRLDHLLLRSLPILSTARLFKSHRYVIRFTSCSVTQPCLIPFLYNICIHPSSTNPTHHISFFFRNHANPSQLSHPKTIPKTGQRKPTLTFCDGIPSTASGCQTIRPGWTRLTKPHNRKDFNQPPVLLLYKTQFASQFPAGFTPVDTLFLTGHPSFRLTLFRCFSSSSSSSFTFPAWLRLTVYSDTFVLIQLIVMWTCLSAYPAEWEGNGHTLFSPFFSASDFPSGTILPSSSSSGGRLCNVLRGYFRWSTFIPTLQGGSFPFD